MHVSSREIQVSPAAWLEQRGFLWNFFTKKLWPRPLLEGRVALIEKLAAWPAFRNHDLGRSGWTWS
jgi:hypothetical protein